MQHRPQWTFTLPATALLAAALLAEPQADTGVAHLFISHDLLAAIPGGTP